MARAWPHDEPRGRVTVSHGRLLRVRTEDGSEALLRAAGRDLSAVCGDCVRCELDTRHQELRVVAVEPRARRLYRSNARGGGELDRGQPVAAAGRDRAAAASRICSSSIATWPPHTAPASAPRVVLNKSGAALGQQLELSELADFEAAGLRAACGLGASSAPAWTHCARCCASRRRCWSASPEWANHRCCAHAGARQRCADRGAAAR